MRNFKIAEIKELSGLSIPQIEQAISREEVRVQGKGRPRQFLPEDAFTFCVIGEMRHLGIDWRRIVGSTASPWPIDNVFEIRKGEFLLLSPMANGETFDISLVTPHDMAGHLRAFKAGAGVLIDASSIVKRIQTFARRG
jgi:hypothetical protein